MTVSELVAKLQTMPPDAVVVYKMFSDYLILEADDIGLQTAEEAKAVDDAWIDKRKAEPHRFGNLSDVEQAFFRGGRYVRCRRSQFPSGEEPVYANVVTFPGN